MGGLTQLTINGTPYPETSHGKYRAYPQDEGELVKMASGREVKEIRGRRWTIEYNYDYMRDDILRICLADLRSDEQLIVDFLVPESGERLTAMFHCIKEPAPSYAFSKGGVAYWHDVSFTLREVSTWQNRR